MVEIAQRLGGLAAKAAAAKILLGAHAERLKRIGLAAAIVLFAGGLVLALRNVPDLFDRVALGPFVLLLATIPAVVALNAAEFLLIARYAGASVRWRSALEVTVYTTAANMLPIPGGVLTRLAALNSYGAPLRVGSFLILVFAAVWGGLSFLYAGSWLFQFGHPAIGAAFLAVGAAMLAPSIVALRRISSQPLLLVGTLAMRMASLLVDSLRILLAVQTLGVTVGFDQASTLVVSGFVATTALILPGGLGLHEALAALLAPLAGIDSAIGFLSTTVNRINVAIGLLIIAAGLMAASSLGAWRQRRSTGTSR